MARDVKKDEAREVNKDLMAQMQQHKEKKEEKMKKKDFNQLEDKLNKLNNFRGRFRDRDNNKKLLGTKMSRTV